MEKASFLKPGQQQLEEGLRMWLNQGPIFSPPHEGTFAETEAVTLTNWASLPAFISVLGEALQFPLIPLAGFVRM